MSINSLGVEEAWGGEEDTSDLRWGACPAYVHFKSKLGKVVADEIESTWHFSWRECEGSVVDIEAFEDVDGSEFS
jgi:hypothetical protein